MNNDVSNTRQLIDQSITNQRRIRANAPLSISIVSNYGQTSRAINGDYLHFQHLIDVILQMKTKPYDINEFIQYCRQEYQTNSATLNQIARFEKTYNKEHALDW